MTRLKSVPPRPSEYSSRRNCQAKDDSPRAVDSPSVDSDAAQEAALSASASASPQLPAEGSSTPVAMVMGDADVDASEAAADSSSCSSSSPSTRSVALSLVTWQLFQQEKTRINPTMTDSMFIDWLLTNVRPSAYFQQFRTPQTAAAGTAAAQEPGAVSDTTVSTQALPSGDSEGTTVSLLPNLQMAATTTPVGANVAGGPPVAPYSGGGSANRLFCAICRKHFSSRAGLIQHQRGMHAWQPHFRCNKCGQRFRWASQLHDHRRKGYCPCVNAASPVTSPPMMSPTMMPNVEVPPTMAPPAQSVNFAGSLVSGGGGALKESGAASSQDMDRDLDCGSSNSPVEDELDEAAMAVVTDAKGAASGDMEDLIKALGEGAAKAVVSDPSLNAGGPAVSCPECAFSTGSRAELEHHFKSDHVVKDLFPCTCGSDFPCLSLFLCHYIYCPIAATDLGLQQGKPKEGRTDAQQPAQAQQQPQQTSQTQQQTPPSQQQQQQQQQQQPPPPPPQQTSQTQPQSVAVALLPNGLALQGSDSAAASSTSAATTSTVVTEPPPLTFGPQAVPGSYGMAPGQVGPAGAATAFYPPLRGAPMTAHEAALNAAGIAVGRPRAPNGQASCQYCHQTFSNKNTLKQHIIGMHSHQAQYHCEHCGKPFRWAPSYYTHRRKCGLALCGLGPSPRGRGRAATAAVGRY